MRKSLVLALALVFAISGATFAATPQFSGEVKVEATSSKGFTGPFDISASTKLDIKFEEEGENWKLNVGLEATDLLKDEGATIKLANYRADLNGEGFDVTLAKKTKIGKVGTPFDFVFSKDEDNADRIRISTGIGGLDTKIALDGGNDIKLFTSMDVNEFTIGGGFAFDRVNADKSSYVGYAKTSFDIVDAEFAAGIKEGDTVWGVGASAGVTEQLTIEGKYKYDGAWDVGATFTEGVIRAKAGFDHKSIATVEGIYRGSEDNQAFGDLFKDDKYYLNVAPAFRAHFTTDKNTVTVEATAPLADNIHAKAKVVAAEGDTTITADARVAVTEKLYVAPYYKKSTSEEFGAKLGYTFGKDATVTVDANSKAGAQTLTGTFTVKF